MEEKGENTLEDMWYWKRFCYRPINFQKEGSASNSKCGMGDRKTQVYTKV